MAVVTIEWTARAAGRHPGFRETVELTDFINGVINGGRAVILLEHAPIVGFTQVYEDPASALAVYEESAPAVAPDVEEADGAPSPE